MDKKILVVDDAMFMRNIIRRVLKENGYTQVWEAQDGEQAIELFREVSPDLVILEALTVGAVDFIVKPFKQDEFSRVVNRCLEQ